MKKILYRWFVLLVLISMVFLLTFVGVKIMDYYKDIWKLPSYTCEYWRESKTVIQWWDSVLMCNQWELYKERIKYYKQKLD